jgi:hypothetical protein
VGDGPRLDWGLLTAFDPDRAARVPPDLARMWQLAGESLNLVARPVERFELAGTLNGHPGHVRSDRAKQNFPAIFAVAVAGYRAREPLCSHSRATAGSALLSWAGIYRPTGNPIDEWFFVPLLQAADLVAWSLRRGEQAALRDFVARNFVPGPSGERDGRTFDFLQRDALHYHVAAVQPLVEVALYAPDLVDRVTRGSPVRARVPEAVLPRARRAR